MANGLSARDEKLLRFFLRQMSPEEVHALHPDWPLQSIITGTKRIVANFSTVYSDAERLAGNRIASARLIDHLSQEVFAEGNEKAIKPLVDALKNQLSEINTAQKRSDADLMKVNSAQATKLAGIAYGALMRLIGRLEARYPEVDVDAVEAEYHELLLEIEAEEEKD